MLFREESRFQFMLFSCLQSQSKEVSRYHSIICPDDTGAVPVEFHRKYSFDRSSRARNTTERACF